MVVRSTPISQNAQKRSIGICRKRPCLIPMHGLIQVIESQSHANHHNAPKNHFFVDRHRHVDKAYLRPHKFYLPNKFRTPMGYCRNQMLSAKQAEHRKPNKKDTCYLPPQHDPIPIRVRKKLNASRVRQRIHPVFHRRKRYKLKAQQDQRSSYARSEEQKAEYIRQQTPVDSFYAPPFRCTIIFIHTMN